MNTGLRIKTCVSDRLEAIRSDRSALFSAIVCILLLILIFYALYVVVRMYTLGIPLWGDEAKMVENIVNRGLREMLTPPLENRQTAPALYLIITKGLTLLFGTSESVLRVFSFVSFIILLIVQGVMIRKVFKVSMVFTLFSVAVSATFITFMQHVNELKPYIGDAAFVLLILLGYYAYREGILGRGIRGVILLAAILSVCMLLSSPAAFAAGAVIVVEFLLVLRRRDRKRILMIILGGALFLAVFVVNYYLWLKPIATDGGMVFYWRNFQFDFHLYSREAILHNISLFRNLLEPVWHGVWFLLPVAVAGFVISLAKRSVYTLTVIVFFFLLTVASTIDKYPMVHRLWMFLYPLLFIYAFVFIDALRVKIGDVKWSKVLQRAIPLFFAFILLVPNLSFPAFARGTDWTLMQGNQVYPLINYVRENIREGEYLYSYISANAIIRYKNGYDTYRIGDVQNDNIIFGTTDYAEDIDRIADTGGAYVLFYHSYFPLSGDPYPKAITKHLSNRGFMEQIMNVSRTFLYWFTDDLARVRASASFDIPDLAADGGRLTGVAHVHNTGAAILAPERPEGYTEPDDLAKWDNIGRLLVVMYKADGRVPSADITDGIILGEFTSPVNPGELAGLHIERSDLEPGEYLIELVVFGQYSFSELGVAPIPVLIE